MEEPTKPDRKTRAGKRKTVKKRKKAFTPTAAAVARLRKRFGMNTSQFAKLVGVSPNTVTNWENGSGELNLRQRTLDALTQVTELTPEQADRKLVQDR